MARSAAPTPDRIDTAIVRRTTGPGVRDATSVAPRNRSSMPAAGRSSSALEHEHDVRAEHQDMDRTEQHIGAWARERDRREDERQHQQDRVDWIETEHHV